MITRWAILTGEYPPQAGGVADYTRQVACGLAAAGDEVHVFAPALGIGKELEDQGVKLFRLPDHFGPRGLAILDRQLKSIKPDRLLVQYVPHAYGWKAMNLLLAMWIAVRARRISLVWVMFHEVAFPLQWPLKHAALAIVNRVMARLVAGSADRIFSSICAWRRLIQRFCPGVRPIEWLPVPSNITDHPSIAAIRTTKGTAIGHFGTYGEFTAKLLESTLLLLLLSKEDRTAVLLGRGSKGFCDRLATRHPGISGRVIAFDGLLPTELAARLRGCDVLVQPYADGISSRRGTAMAGLANGIPLVSNLGALSESLWASADCIGLARSPSPGELAAATETVLSLKPAERALMGQRAVIFYRGHFGLDNIIDCLRNPPEWSAREP